MLLRTIVAHPEIELLHFEVTLPSLDEIFIRVVGNNSPQDT